MTVQAQRLPPHAPAKPIGVFAVRYGLLALLVALTIAFAVLRPSFASSENIPGLLRSAGIAMIMFLGLTWVLAAGEMDVSFVSIAALANMSVAGLVVAGYGWPVAILAGLAASLAVGATNGLLIGYLGLPSLVITIATGGIGAALAAGIGFGSSIAVPYTGLAGSAVEAQFGLVPVIAVLAVVLYVGAWYLQERLVFGHYIYAQAQNRRAVVEAGIPAQKLVALLYLATALTSGLAGVLLTIDLSSGQPSIASSYFLDGLTSVLLGGVMIKLGKPNVIGTAVGVLILAVLVRGGALLGWDDSKFQIIQGCLLLAGVTVVIRSRDE